MTVARVLSLLGPKNKTQVDKTPAHLLQVWSHDSLADAAAFERITLVGEVKYMFGSSFVDAARITLVGMNCLKWSQLQAYDPTPL